MAEVDPGARTVVFEEPQAVRRIAVVGAHDPARSIAIGHLLTGCIAQHGWSERLEVTTIGVADGAGRAKMDDLVALARSGLDVAATSCPDLSGDASLVEEADLVVVGSDLEANMLIQWPETEGKQVYALSDFLDEDSHALDNPRADLAQFINQAAQAIPSLLRSLIAMRN